MKRHMMAVTLAIALPSVMALAGERIGQDDLNLSLPVAFECAKGNFSRCIGKPWMSAEEAVAAYVEYARKEGLFDYGLGPDPRAIFLDVDFDGVLELIVWREEGSACCKYSDVYRIDMKTHEVIKVDYNGSAGPEDWVGATWKPGDTHLIQQKGGGRRYYLTNAWVRSDSRGDSYVGSLRRFLCGNHTFIGECIAQIAAERVCGNLTAYECEYKFCGTTIASHKALAEAVKRMCVDFIDLHVRLGVAEYLTGVADAELKAKLMKAYRSFGFRQGNY